MQRPSPQDILLRTLRRATEERDSIRQQPLTRLVQNTTERSTFFNHVLTTFFVGNEGNAYIPRGVRKTPGVCIIPRGVFGIPPVVIRTPP